MDINRDQRGLVVTLVKECLGSLRLKSVGLLGLAFKPNTDDIREAPSIEIAQMLIRGGAKVRACDPAAVNRAKAVLPEVEYLRDAYAVADGADALIVVTEWNEFRNLDLRRIRRTMRQPVLIDGRNIFDPAEMRELGFTYRGIGRN
jgi:UDPglucose 6-dehydrogenase